MRKANDYQKITLELPKSGIPSFGDENEIFHQIRGYKNYYISSYGRVVKRKDNGFERVEPLGLGTNRVRLINDYDETMPEVDRLVADEFLFTICGKDRLVHKDGNAQNCRYDNLIYLSRDESLYIKKSRFHEINEKHVETLLNRQKYSQFAQFGVAAIRRIRFNILHPNGKDTNIIDVCGEWADPNSGMDAFKKWCWTNIYEFPIHNGELLQFDKTIMSYGEDKPYSPDSCCFVPQYIIDLINDKKGISIGQKTKKGTPYRVTPMGRGGKTFYSYDEAQKYLYNAKADYLLKVIDEELEKGFLPIKIINALQKWVDGWKSGLYRVGGDVAREAV